MPRCSISPCISGMEEKEYRKVCTIGSRIITANSVRAIRASQIRRLLGFLIFSIASVQPLQRRPLAQEEHAEEQEHDHGKDIGGRCHVLVAQLVVHIAHVVL